MRGEAERTAGSPPGSLVRRVERHVGSAELMAVDRGCLLGPVGWQGARGVSGSAWPPRARLPAVPRLREGRLGSEKHLSCKEECAGFVLWKQSFLAGVRSSNAEGAQGRHLGLQ